MKKLIVASLIGLTAFGAQAHDFGHHGYWRPHNGGGWGWVAPAVVGGVIVYEATRPPVYVAPPPPPVVVQQVPVYTPVTTCSEWREVVQPDGRIVRERTCYQQ